MSALWPKLFALGCCMTLLVLKCTFQWKPLAHNTQSIFSVLVNSWNERPHRTDPEVIYKHLKGVMLRKWAFLWGKGLCCHITNLGMLGISDGKRLKKAAGPCWQLYVNTGKIRNRLCFSAVTCFLLLRCVNCF